MKESGIEKILREEVKKLGGRAYKWVSPGNDGVPDRIVIFPGRPPIFVELKTGHGRLTPLQEVQIARLEALGQDAEAIYGLDGLCQFFRDKGYAETGRGIERRYGHRERG